MKVVAEVNTDVHLCEVTHHELEKFLNLYYGKMERIQVGDEVDLGKGYDFASDVRSAFNTTEAMLKDNAKVLKAITEGVTVCCDDNRKRIDWNIAASDELGQINDYDVSPVVWKLIQNAIEFLK